MRGLGMSAMTAGVVLLMASAVGAEVLTLSDRGIAPGTNTRVYGADLNSIVGLTQVGSITFTDDGTPVGGAAGIFSGFDLDAVFLDADGNLATTADRTFASSFIFSAGSTRPTGGNSTLEPSAGHPGPTFGSLDAHTIDYATATLNVLDAVAIAHVDLADGFLTLGDGGMLIANFSPTVSVTGTLFVLVGEVGGQAGEGLGASVVVSSQPVPEPSTLALLGLGAVGLFVARRRRKRAA